MKASLGRGELLAWLNAAVETSYQKIEQCADGVGYCQLLDSLHPGLLPLSKLKLLPRSLEDHAHNLRLLNELLARVKIDRKVPIDKVAKGVFLQNLNLLQWLHAYAAGQAVPGAYQGYELRRQVSEEMSAHLIPNEQFLREDERARYEDQMATFLRNLEKDLKQRMESNYRQITALNGFVKQRSQHYDLLRKIERLCQNDRSPVAKQVLAILVQTPESFKPSP